MTYCLPEGRIPFLAFSVLQVPGLGLHRAGGRGRALFISREQKRKPNLLLTSSLRRCFLYLFCNCSPVPVVEVSVHCIASSCLQPFYPWDAPRLTPNWNMGPSSNLICAAMLPLPFLFFFNFSRVVSFFTWSLDKVCKNVVVSLAWPIFDQVVWLYGALRLLVCLCPILSIFQDVGWFSSATCNPFH